MKKDDHHKQVKESKQKIGHNIDVEFSESLADEDDRQAQARARKADKRVKED